MLKDLGFRIVFQLLLRLCKEQKPLSLQGCEVACMDLPQQTSLFSSTAITKDRERHTQTNIRKSPKQSFQMLYFHQLCLCLALISLFHAAELYLKHPRTKLLQTCAAAALQKNPLLLSFLVTSTFLLQQNKFLAEKRCYCCFA